MDDLKEFLKDYVDVLRSDFPWEVIAPCSSGVSMPGGAAKVLSCSGETIAYFHTKVPVEEYNPSMPISHRDFACAKLLVDTINLLAGIEEKM